MRTTLNRLLSGCTLVMATAAAGCGGGQVIRPQLPNSGHDPAGLAKCSVAASQSSPLVTEWPASEKANLEARSKEGGVAVAYSGCEMRLLPQCRVGGAYKWSRTTLAEDTVDIRSEDDLYAKLPLGAASLEAELKSSGRLAVRTIVAGQMKLDGVATGEVPSTGDCSGATHVIGGLAVGAFRLYTGGSAKAAGGAAVGPVGGGSSTSSEEVLVRRAGDPAKCGEATDAQPSPDCQSPIQVFLWPLPKKGNASADGGSDGPAPPNAVRVDFLLPNAGEKWRVMNRDTLVCEMPCSQWVARGSALSLRRDGATAGETFSIDLPPELGGYTPGRTIEAVPKESTDTSAALGLTGTILGSTGTLMGGLLWVIGSDPQQEDQRKLEGPGRTTFLISAPVLATGIVLLSVSRFQNSVDLSLAPNQAARGPAVRLGPGYLTAGSAGPTGFRVLVSPGGFAGAF